MPSDSETQQLPPRVVDRETRGWYLTGPASSGLYRLDLPGRDEQLEYALLDERHGPLRPVQPISNADREQLAALLAACGRKAAASVMAAIHRATRRERVPGANPIGPSRLRAGRYGSWEAEAFSWLAWSLGRDLAERPKRISEREVNLIADMLERWSTDPQRYTEVAATLAEQFSAHADRAGGWPKCADRWLCPTRAIGCPDPAIMERVVNYLLSTAQCREEVADVFGDMALADAGLPPLARQG